MITVVLRVEYRRIVLDDVVPLAVIDSLGAIGAASPTAAVVTALAEIDALSTTIGETLATAKPWSEGGASGVPLTSFGRVGAGRPDAEILVPPGPLCDPHRHSVLTAAELQNRAERHFRSRGISLVAGVRSAFAAAESELTSDVDEAILEMLRGVAKELDLGRIGSPLGEAMPILKLEQIEGPPPARKPHRRVSRDTEPAGPPDPAPELRAVDASETAAAAGEAP